jgi:Raf kinase inhibitor-like YbhB/YbcL family protein
MKKKLLVGLTTGLFVAGMMGTSLAENEATFDFGTGTLNIPKVDVGSVYYNVDMQQQGQDLDFEVTLATPSTSSSTENIAIYNSSTGDLNIPTVIVGSDSYNVDMAQQGYGYNFSVTNASDTENNQPDENEYTQISISSSAYGNGDAIPLIYSCDSDNISPPLSWTSPPVGTQSYTIIMDDPDAQSVAGYTWVHWNVFNIPVSLNNFIEDSSITEATEGSNDSQAIGYSGPCPPSNTFDHTYNLRIYALDSVLEPIPYAPLTQQEFENQYAAHIIDQSELLQGTFGR